MVNQFQFRIVLLGVLVAGVALVWMEPSRLSAHQDCTCLVVSFLDVGQGDSIYIKTPDGFDMLVDGGVDSAVIRELGYRMNFFDREIDVVVATHPDADHIGGLSDVFSRYQIGTFIETTNINNTPAAAALAAVVKEENVQYINPEAGQVITLGEEVYIQILAPEGDETNWESNNASIVLRVVYGDTAFMLTGDLPAEIENHLVTTYGTQLRSDVLKLGHHGSKTSTSEAWLDAVQPRFAVVSASLDNRYGHPNQDVMARVFARNIQSSHTGTDGTITFYSDGQTVWRE